MSGSENICQNRKARHEYLVLDTIEAGIVLAGHEVKSLRQHHASLEGSYAQIVGGEVWLINCNIETYKFASWTEPDPKRKRKLLLKKKQIKSFAEKGSQKGFTLVPLSLYFLNGRAKVELAVCKGKQEHDKRQSLKEKDAKREMRDDS